MIKNFRMLDSSRYCRLRAGLPLLMAVGFLWCGHFPLAGNEDKSLAFAREVEQRILPQPSVQGDDPTWFFLVKELRHLAEGRFWQRPWSEVAENGSDPIPSILEFHNLLKERGIDLLLVPVPAKGAIYPEKLASDFEPGDPASTSEFFHLIEEAGVSVLDLDPVFREAREREETKPLYCRQDAHFSPAAIELVADSIAKMLGLKAEEESSFEIADSSEVSIVGDQIAGTDWEGSVPPETIHLRKVSQSGSEGVKPDPASPVLLLGDSHTLVFHEGKAAGMHTEGAGLHDHLSARAGYALDLVGVRGSGLVQARKALFYHATSEPGYWEKKKHVVWLFSVREFTQSRDKLISIPLDR